MNRNQCRFGSTLVAICGKRIIPLFGRLGITHNLDYIDACRQSINELSANAHSIPGGENENVEQYDDVYLDGTDIDWSINAT